MNELQKKQLALLKDTIAYYSADTTKRCMINTSTCRYLGESLDKPHSDGCAVGRLLTPELRLQFDRMFPDKTVHYKPLFNLLPQEVQAYGVDFLGDLQNLHDFSSYWDENGLSKDGLIRKDVIMSKYKLVEEFEIPKEVIDSTEITFIKKD